MSSIASPTLERTSTIPGTSALESPAPMQRVMSIDALRGMDMFFIVGMEEVFEALSKMFPMSPSLNDRMQHAPWAGFQLDIKNHRDWCRPFVWIGMNAITIYLIADFVNLEAIAKCFVGGEIHS